MSRCRYRPLHLPTRLSAALLLCNGWGIVVLCTVALTCWMFAEALFGGGLFAFRDAGHYYYPLLQLVAEQWKAGRLPLWNPYENLGMPLAGNPTAGVFYPPALLFVLPIGAAWAYRIYVIGHVLLAAWGAYRLARQWRSGPTASAVAAVSYAFCGNILFQHCNVVFLVGAAWLPFALVAMDRMIVGQRLDDAICWAAVLAMMILGGGAEMAYHAVLLAALYWLWMTGRSGSTTGSSAATESSTIESPGRTSPVNRSGIAAGQTAQRPGRWKSLGLLALGTIAAALLAAVQVLPAWEFSRRSTRNIFPVPRSLWELPGSFLSEQHHVEQAEPVAPRHWGEGLLGRPLRATHHEHVFHFSVAPCRVVEYVWPNLFGRMFPENHRWLLALGGEQRIWTPTLYMGLLPFVLAVVTMRFRKGPKRTTWLSWIALLSLVASFGYYGLGYLAIWVAHTVGVDTAEWLIGPPFGGLYWLMTVLLPSYVYFRYPAKLLVITALALSLLAAQGTESLRPGTAPASATVSRRRTLRILSAIAAGSAIGAAALLLGKPLWRQLMQHGRADPLFGPLDVEGAFFDLLVALVHATAISAAGWWLLRTRCSLVFIRLGIVLLLVVDLAAANRWLIACVPAEVFDKPPSLLATMQRPETHTGGARPKAAGKSAASSGARREMGRRSTADCNALVRVWRRPLWLPESWSRHRSPERLAESIAWQRDTLWPRYNLLWKIAVLEVEGTMKPRDYQFVLWVARHLGRQSGRAPAVRGGKTHGPTASQHVAALPEPVFGPVIDKPASSPPFFLPLNVDYAIVRHGERFTGTAPVEPQCFETSGNGACRQVPEDAVVRQVPGALPRAWIVHRVRRLRPLATADPTLLWQRTEQVFFPGRSMRDLRHEAVVETPWPIPGGGRQDQAYPPGATAGEFCRIVCDRPCRVEVEVQLARAGLLVLCDQYWPGWEAWAYRVGSNRGARQVPHSPPMHGATLFSQSEVNTIAASENTAPLATLWRKTMSPVRRVPVLRTNRVMRGVWLPEGRYRVVFRYRPMSFLAGATTSVLAWLCVLVGLVCSGSTRRHQRG